MLNASCQPYARGDNATVVTIGPLTVWFSYKTVVAFRVAGHDRVVRQNEWGKTTGGHLNAIDGGDRDSRVSGESFERAWAEQVEPLFAAGVA